jgi:High potential iron-sulfur protein
VPTVASKDSASYTPHGTPVEHCSICRYWSPGPSPRAAGQCAIVAGAIAPGGWCRYFEHVPEVA